MAFYAPRGITPEAIRRMSLADRAGLRVGRARWYQEQAMCTQYGVALAFAPPEKGEDDGREE